MVDAEANEHRDNERICKHEHTWNGVMVNVKSVDHSCCQKEAQKKPGKESSWKSLRSSTFGAIAAFAACLCCSLPLIPLMVGLSGAEALKDQLGLYHQSFEVAAFIILVGACGYMWRQHRKADKPLYSFVLQVVATFSMYVAMTFVMKEIVAPAIFHRNGLSMTHNSHGHR